MTSARILATLAVLSSSAVHAEPVPLPVSICDAHNSPKTRLARGGYAFCDPDGWLTSAVLGGAGLGLLAYGLATLKHGCGPYDDHDPACIDNKRHILYGNTT